MNYLKTLLCLCFIIPHLSFATSGGQDGNGGGGVKVDGRYMTFYSAGFYTDSFEESSEAIPQLNELIRFFNDFKHLNPLSRIKYIKAMLPSSQRKYYKVKESSFTVEVRERLIEEYKRVIDLDDRDKIALFAITDTNSETTYLLPNFYKLTAVQQQAILFHENYWIVNNNATYSEVIQAEMTFQAYLENTHSVKRLVNLMKLTGERSDVLRATINYDLKNNTLNGLARNGQVRLISILGEDWLECHKLGLRESCYDYVAANLYSLTQRHPESLFLNFAYESAIEGRLLTMTRKSAWGSSKNYDMVKGTYSPEAFKGFYSSRIMIDLNQVKKTEAIINIIAPELKNYKHLVGLKL